MDIRKAVAKDAGVIKALLEQLGYESSRQSISDVIRSPHNNTELFVAVLEKKVVAFMSTICFYYFPSDCNICRITGITVDSTVRGEGIGNKLITYAANIAKDNNCKQLEITTSLAREKTQKYYEFLGFKKTSFRYYQAIGSEQNT